MKNNKYFDLIITKIKNHRKYDGLEAILEDIANDVYEHSAIVLESVENEEVISTYLDKVIATSIITVPKRLNFNTRVRHRVLTMTEPKQVETQTTLEEPLFEEFTDLPEENFEEFSELVEPEEEVLEQEEVKEEILVDKSLIDKMINGNSTYSKEYSQEETFAVEEEVLAVEEQLEELDVEEEVLDVEESLEELDVKEEVLEVEEPLKELDVEEEVLEVEEPLEELDVEEEVLEVEEPLEELDVEEEVLEVEEQLEELDVEEEVLEVEEPLEELDTESINNSNNEFTVPDFSCFSYKPTIDDVDIEDYENELIALQKSYSNIDIEKLCHLKFTKNMSIEEISNLLNISKNDVLEALGDIIDKLKD